jgi:hypothetical protein
MHAMLHASRFLGLSIPPRPNLRLITNVELLLPHAEHGHLVPGPSYDAREDGPGGVLAGETSLDHACEEERRESAQVFFESGRSIWLTGSIVTNDAA